MLYLRSITNHEPSNTFKHIRTKLPKRIIHEETVVLHILARNTKKENPLSGGAAITVIYTLQKI